MERGKGCACCSCGCFGCLMPIIAAIVVIGLLLAIFAPFTHEYQHMIPDDFRQIFPDINEGTRLPSHEGMVAPVYDWNWPSGQVTFSSLL